MVRIKLQPCISLVFLEQLQSIVVDEDGRRAALTGIRLHGLLERVYGRRAALCRYVSQ